MHPVSRSDYEHTATKDFEHAIEFNTPTNTEADQSPALQDVSLSLNPNMCMDRSPLTWPINNQQPNDFEYWDFDVVIPL